MATKESLPNDGPANKELSLAELEAMIEPVYEMRTFTEIVRDWLPRRKKQRNTD